MTTPATAADLKPCFLCGKAIPAVPPFRPELHRMCPEVRECLDRAMAARRREGKTTAGLEATVKDYDTEAADARDAAVAAAARGIADALQGTAQPGEETTS